MDEFVLISNDDAWDLYLENLKLKEQIKELNLELSLTRNPIYCEDCGACGETGCCSPNRCLYVDTYQGEYNDLVEELNKHNQYSAGCPCCGM